jgi:hypothetical protein
MNRKSILATFALALLALPFAGCPAKNAPSENSGAVVEDTAALDRQRALEEKKAEIDRLSEEIPNMTGSEQDKIDAVTRLDQLRREYNELAEGGTP